MAEYGFSEAFLKANPALKALVDQATEGQWTPDKFMDEVRKTKWWKGLSDQQKAFDVERVENPAEIARQVQAMSLSIRSMATRMGFSTTSSNAAARKYAEMAVRNGWTEEEVRLYVGGMFTKGGSEGAAGQTQAQLREMEANYGISIGNRWRNAITRAVLQGVRTVEDYETFIRDQAKRHYKAIASDLDAGFTVRQVLDPYIQSAAQELGINPNTVDITKGGLWTAPIQYVPKGEKEARAMTQDEWVARMRTDRRYGYDKTQGAQRSGAELAAGISKMMGAMG